MHSSARISRALAMIMELLDAILILNSITHIYLRAYRDCLPKKTQPSSSLKNEN